MNYCNTILNSYLNNYNYDFIRVCINISLFLLILQKRFRTNIMISIHILNMTINVFGNSSNNSDNKIDIHYLYKNLI